MIIYNAVFLGAVLRHSLLRRALDDVYQIALGEAVEGDPLVLFFPRLSSVRRATRPEHQERCALKIASETEPENSRQIGFADVGIDQSASQRL